MPEAAAFCPGCGRAMRPVERVQGKVGALPARLVGALAYCLIPAAIFLFVEPYKSNRFARFHSLQSLGLLGAGIAAAVALWIVGSVMGLLSVLPLFFVSMLVGLAFFVIWMVLVVKALQGEMLKLPLVGDLAEQLAGTS